MSYRKDNTVNFFSILWTLVSIVIFSILVYFVFPLFMNPQGKIQNVLNSTMASGHKILVKQNNHGATLFVQIYYCPPSGGLEFNVLEPIEVNNGIVSNVITIKVPHNAEDEIWQKVVNDENITKNISPDRIERLLSELLVAHQINQKYLKKYSSSYYIVIAAFALLFLIFISIAKLIHSLTWDKYHNPINKLMELEGKLKKHNQSFEVSSKALTHWTETHLDPQIEGSMLSATEKLSTGINIIQESFNDILREFQNAKCDITNVEEKIDDKIIPNFQKISEEINKIKHYLGNVYLGHQQISKIFENYKVDFQSINFLGSLQYLNEIMNGGSEQINDSFKNLGMQISSNIEDPNRTKINILVIDPKSEEVTSGLVNLVDSFSKQLVKSMHDGLKVANKGDINKKVIHVEINVRILCYPYPISFLSFGNKYLYLSIISQQEWSDLIRNEYGFGIVVSTITPNYDAQLNDQRRSLCEMVNSHFDCLFTKAGASAQNNNDQSKVISVSNQYYDYERKEINL